MLAGDPLLADASKHGNIQGDAFGSPDGLWFDPRGPLWIETDISTSVLNRGDYAGIGNNQMLCADIASGRIKRVSDRPQRLRDHRHHDDAGRHARCSSTSSIRAKRATERSDPGAAAGGEQLARWPDGGRPRSATVVIRRDDGGIIGT